MPEISEIEYDFFGEIAVAQTVDDYERLAIPFCSAIFSVQSVVAIRFHRDRVPTVLFRWIPDDRLRETFDRFYDKLGYMLDPFYQMALETKDWEACSLREIAPDRFETSDYYSNYFGATNMVDEMGFTANTQDDSAVHLSVGRNSGQRRFRASEAVKFRTLSKILAPKLRQVLGARPPSVSSAAPTLANQFFALAKTHAEDISKREAEVAALIVQGHSSRAIGLKLGISAHTVKVHRRNLYKKLNISSQSDLFGLLTRFVEKVFD